MKYQTVPLQIESILGDGYHVFIQANIGRKKARLLLDTGASKTVLSLEFANKYLKSQKRKTNEEQATGLGSNSIQNEVGMIRTIKIGHCTIPNLTVAILDLSHVNETYRRIELPAVDGVLGSDVLMQTKAIIDYAKSRMSLKS